MMKIKVKNKKLDIKMISELMFKNRLFNYAMQKISLSSIILVFASVFATTFCDVSWAQEKTPTKTMSIKAEGAKMAAVPFSHQTHADKDRITCNICHHKAKEGKQYKKCVDCHSLKDTNNDAPAAKDAFHKQCQNCHKEIMKKCNECHKK
ncbi:MAG: cytochrome c family protein [Syntrophobacterales bacterium]|jgi:hypothetical protein|nr:cytochrome c family protein [Syntrophobacterales bacterium]